jgi:hypothetical protein
MSKATRDLRTRTEGLLDMLEMSAFNDGFEAAIEAVEQLSDEKFNQDEKEAAEVLRWLAKELRGENC